MAEKLAQNNSLSRFLLLYRIYYQLINIFFMKKTFSVLFLIALCFFSMMKPLQAQKKYATAGEYMTNISQEFRKITEAYLFYNSEIAHTKKARAVEKSRMELISTVTNAKKRTAAMPAWQENTTFRDAAGEFFRIYEIVLKEDYEQIMNLEDIAEQSYDAMEAYMTVKDVASDKLNEANELVEQAQEKFAADFNINLVQGEDDKITKKAKEATEVNKYHRMVYLIFFKAYKQDAYLLEAQKNGDVSGMQQNQSTLLKVAEEQMKYLDTIPKFKGNASLKEACHNYLMFALKEAKEADYVSFFLEKEKFEETQKKFKAIAKPNKEEVDEVNEAVTNYNNMVNKSNKDNINWNNARAKVLSEWNNESQNFISKNIPHYKK